MMEYLRGGDADFVITGGTKHRGLDWVIIARQHEGDEQNDE